MEVSSSAYARAVTIRPVPEPVQYLWWSAVTAVSIASLVHLSLPLSLVTGLVMAVVILVLAKAQSARRHHRNIARVTIDLNGRIEIKLTADARLDAFAGVETCDQDEPRRDNKRSADPVIYCAGLLVLLGTTGHTGLTWSVCHTAGVAGEQRKRLRLFLSDPRFTPVFHLDSRRDAVASA